MFDKELVNANPNTLAWHQKCARIGPHVTTWQLYFLLLYLNLSLSHSGLFINPEHAVHALVTWPLLIPSTCFKIPLHLSTYINPTHFKRMAVVHFLHEIFAYYLNPWIALSPLNSCNISPILLSIWWQPLYLSLPATEGRLLLLVHYCWLTFGGQIPRVSSHGSP